MQIASGRPGGHAPVLALQPALPVPRPAAVDRGLAVPRPATGWQGQLFTEGHRWAWLAPRAGLWLRVRNPEGALSSRPHAEPAAIRASGLRAEPASSIRRGIRAARRAGGRRPSGHLEAVAAVRPPFSCARCSRFACVVFADRSGGPAPAVDEDCRCCRPPCPPWSGAPAPQGCRALPAPAAPARPLYPGPSQRRLSERQRPYLPHLFSFMHTHAHTHAQTLFSF